MQQVKLSLLMTTFIGFTAAAAPASAQGTYLLQLGSSESRAKAETKWDELRKKYPSLLGQATMRISDIALPPDNFIVYRTQAGPFLSKSSAQSACSELSANGDECFVVETAMTSGEIAAAEPVPAAPFNIESSAPLGEGLKLVSNKGEVAGSLAALPTFGDEVIIETTPEAPSLLEVAQDQAAEVVAAAQPEVLAAPSQVEPVEAVREEEESSWDFLSFLNPFSEDEEVAVAKAEDVAESVQKDADVEAPLASDVVKLEPQVTASVPLVIDTPVEAVSPALLDAPVATTTSQLEALNLENAPLLSPPPAPPSTEELLASQAAHSLASPVQPFQNVPVAAETTSKPAEITFEQAKPMIGESGGVDVAEAIPVPLSSGQALSAPIAVFQPEALQALGLPSQTTRGRTMWGQVDYFSDQQSALAFWESFRRANPTFPPVRVRVTSPYLGAKDGRVSLKVGPFSTDKKSSEFCQEVSKNEGISCGTSVDLGGSSQAVFGHGLRSRYEGRALGQSDVRGSAAAYWVQLGSYTTADAARQGWSALKQQHPALASVSPSVVTPDLASGMQPVYRLRTGPFAVRLSADNLCFKLKAQQSNCVVVYAK